MEAQQAEQKLKNTPHRIAQWKKWRDNNPEKIKAWKKIRYTCGCGKELAKNSKFGHLKSKRHLTWIEATPTNERKESADLPS